MGSALTLKKMKRTQYKKRIMAHMLSIVCDLYVGVGEQTRLDHWEFAQLKFSVRSYKTNI